MWDERDVWMGDRDERDLPGYESESIARGEANVGEFRKKPVVIQAWRLTEETADDISKLPGVVVRRARPHHPTSPRGTLECAEIVTLEGTMLANVGDWIIRGVKGEFYPCKPDIFDATYGPVERNRARGGE